jgi:hypothetical protein
MGLTCTPSIFYYLFGGKYIMGVTHSNLIVEIRLHSRFEFSLLAGFPYPHSTHVASHFVVSSSRPVYLLIGGVSLFVFGDCLGYPL